jgi:hypothetical protein
MLRSMLLMTQCGTMGFHVMNCDETSTLSKTGASGRNYMLQNVVQRHNPITDIWGLACDETSTLSKTGVSGRNYA